LYNEEEGLCLTKIAKAASILPLIMNLKALGESEPERLVDFALSYPVIKPSQVRSEFKRFAALVAKQRPKFVLEIGTLFGGTLLVISRLADPGATIISVDLPGGKFGAGYHWLRTPIFRCFPTKGQRLHLLRANSHDLGTQSRVRELLQGQKLDLLFIDGDHTYDGVKEDFDGYKSLVRRGGVIVFHDVVEHPAERGCEVSRLWNEVKQRYPHEEIIEDRNQGWAGFGVLTV